MPVIENESIRLEAVPKAGEMISLLDKKKNREVLYQADQGWSGRNPSLFPMVGSTWNAGKYEIDGVEYALKNHGLIRYAMLEDQSSPDEIRFVFNSGDETRKQYPFDFHYEMSYRLENNKVLVDYAITSCSKTDMPFSFGLHPAFKTSQNNEEKFEDFVIDFSPKAQAEQIVFSKEGGVYRKPVELDEWKLSRADLDHYKTLVFENPSCTSAVLKYKDEPRIKMNFKDYPYLALWSHPDPSDFVCIEPWFGHADFEEVHVPFDQREGTQILKPGETFKAAYEIEVL